MSITLLTGPSGSGKSRRLIEVVQAAQAQGRAVSTFMARAAAQRSADPNVWSHGKIGSREPGLLCRLDHIVTSEECADILRTLAPGTLAAFDEARFFDVGVVDAWREASRRGLELLVSTPSPEQVAVLGDGAIETRMSMTCRRCGLRDAASSVVLPGTRDAISVCADCDEEIARPVRAEVVTRLRQQEPYPGEEALYQPVELQECASWRVLRVDSARRVELMREVIDEIAARDGTRTRTYMDLGCNTGYFCHAMARLDFASLGVDVVEDDIEVARLLTSYVRRDGCRYVVADIHDYLQATRSQPIDVISAFSVVQWLILQRSLQAGLEAFAWMFEKVGRICFLEMGYASEALYSGRLPELMDRAWVRRTMEDSRQFDEIRCYDAGEHGLMRDLFVGLKERAPAVRDPANDALAAMSPFDDPDEIAQRVPPLLRGLLQSDVRRGSFRLWEQQGIHVTPVDYYQPIPDTGALQPALWERPSELVGVEMNVEMQLRLVSEGFRRYHRELDELLREPPAEPHRFHMGNGMFDGMDALVCWCMIRHFRPRRIIEVGSGFSTRLLAEAAGRNGCETSLVAVDPYADGIVAEGFPGLVGLERRPVQHLEASFFESLQADDVLFIDSSHVSRIGGDVNFLFLDVLPRLRAGVLVHVHDIFLPAEYPREWVMEKGRFWNEQYLLQAFLTFNHAWEVLVANAFLGRHHREELKAAFPGSPWLGGGSFWMRRREL